MRIQSFLAAGLLLVGATLPAHAEEAAVTVEASVAGAALPAVDPDAYFKGKGGGTFGKDAASMLPASKRVGVAGFRVVFITDNSIKAQVRASYFGGTDRSGANARMDVALTGVDNATMQAITDKAYANFLAQLAAAGREVVPQAELQEFLSQVEAAPLSQVHWPRPHSPHSVSWQVLLASQTPGAQEPAMPQLDASRSRHRFS